MFDQAPNSSSLAGAVAGIAANSKNKGERLGPYYLPDIFDPDVHPIDDLHKYVVPQENELVFDVPNGRTFRVAHVDWQGGTLKSTLVLWPNDEGNNTDQDWIFGPRGGPGLGEALLSVDYSVRPNVARIDSTIMRPGAAYALLFLGDNVDKDNGGKIISAQYSSGGAMQTNKVPCVEAALNGYTNYNIMTTGQFSVTENEESLSNGRRCTAVFYDQGGQFIPPAQSLMVQHSAYMRDHRIGIRYITEIELVSPWFTNIGNPDRLIVPINVNLFAIELRAIIHYSDGFESDPMPVNGDRFTLHGLEEYRPKAPGQTARVTLGLSLLENEQLLIAEPGSPNHKSRIYTIQAGAVEGAYSPKLYTYPQWSASLGGYRLQHFLYDLDRKTFIDVSDLVTLNDQSPAWHPSSYGIAQSMVFNLNLKLVSPTFESVVFTMHTEIILLKDINGPGARYSVNYAYGKPTYTAGFVVANNNGVNTTFNLTNGHTTLEAWLNALYWKVDPSYDVWDEDSAPTPTHFELVHEDGRRWQFSVADWNKNNPINITMQKGKTWYINWLNKDANGTTLQLAATGLTVELA